eukprot:1194610-Prorocentrum_minimum.AAC.7
MGLWGVVCTLAVTGTGGPAPDCPPRANLDGVRLVVAHGGHAQVPRAHPGVGAGREHAPRRGPLPRGPLHLVHLRLRGVQVLREVYARRAGGEDAHAELRVAASTRDAVRVPERVRRHVDMEGERAGHDRVADRSRPDAWHSFHRLGNGGGETVDNVLNVPQAKLSVGGCTQGP